MQVERRHVVLVTTPSFVAERPEVLRRFTRALAQGVLLYGSQPEVVTRAIANFFQLDPVENQAAIEDTRAHYAPLYTPLPYPPVEGYRLALEELAQTNPRAASFRLTDLIDDRFVREVEASGLAR